MTNLTCSVDGCIKPTLARTWCGTHYRRWQRTGSLETTRFLKRHCSIGGCANESEKRGWCGGHYRRWLIKGDVLAGTPLKVSRTPVVDGQKQCLTCSGLFAVEESDCPSCKKARAIAWRQANPTYWLDWQRANRDKVAQIAHQRRAQKLGRESERIDRSVVFERDGYTCQLCMEPIDMELRFPDLGSPSLDHIIPLNKGGHHLYSNVQSAHFGCNSAKGDRILTGGRV